MKRGSFEQMKSTNKSIILNEIRKFSPISRAQIAKNTGLTPPTVSSIVKELIDQTIVVETEAGESLGGRRPILLHINPSVFSIIGIDAGPNQIIGVISNLEGDLLYKHAEKIERPLSNEKFLETLSRCVQTILDKNPTIQDNLLGIGVAMHGVVDTEKGISIVTPNLGLKNIPIKKFLEDKFDIEVSVENDARLMALGEAWFGGHGDIENMLAVNIGRGVGGGLIIDKKLYRGKNDIAGEVGHMTIDLNGDVCECGNKGCFQALATGDAIIKRAIRKLPNFSEHKNLTAEEIYQKAMLGESVFISTINEVGEIIGIGLSNLINILNPEKIVLGGGVMNSSEIIFPKILETVNKRSLTGTMQQTNITITNLGKDATIKGAVAQFIEKVYE